VDGGVGVEDWRDRRGGRLLIICWRGFAGCRLGCRWTSEILQSQPWRGEVEEDGSRANVLWWCKARIKTVGAYVAVSKFDDRPEVMVIEFLPQLFSALSVKFVAEDFASVCLLG